MKIITISIANRVDRPPGEGDEIRGGEGGKSALIRWRLGRRDWRDERIGPEAKRVLVQSNLRAAGLGMAARGKEHHQHPRRWTRKIEDRRGGGGVVTADETKGGEQRWIENYCSHGLHANWIIKFSASVVSPSARTRPLSPYFAHGSFLRPTDDPPNRLSMLRARAAWRMRSLRVLSFSRLFIY